jgi:hypothetical protein
VITLQGVGQAPAGDGTRPRKERGKVRGQVHFPFVPKPFIPFRMKLRTGCNFSQDVAALVRDDGRGGFWMFYRFDDGITLLACRDGRQPDPSFWQVTLSLTA